MAGALTQEPCPQPLTLQCPVCVQALSHARSCAFSPRFDPSRLVPAHRRGPRAGRARGGGAAGGVGVAAVRAVPPGPASGSEVARDARGSGDGLAGARPHERHAGRRQLKRGPGVARQASKSPRPHRCRLRRLPAGAQRCQTRQSLGREAPGGTARPQRLAPEPGPGPRTGRSTHRPTANRAIARGHPCRRERHGGPRAQALTGHDLVRRRVPAG